MRCLPLALWGVACSESASNPVAKDVSGGASTGGASTSGSSNGGSSNGGSPETGGKNATTGGASTTTGGKKQEDNSGGSAGDDEPPLSCPAGVGANASAADFSPNTETGQRDAHVLLMSEGDIIRRVMNYTTSGDADHEHEFVFTDEQLVALLAGEEVVVETDGPPLNAASGHTHTVRVHPCKA
ncbi:MAG TPA: hypothetical protein VEX18_07295 [Polyangiaceae bacterium]|nr:hypothetical protein [Polyangiaceae bacterium]